MACLVTRSPIDVPSLLRDAASAADGAVLLFLGTVRDSNDGRPVGHLEYEAYAGMAEREMDRIVGEARGRWSTGEISVVHRVGRLGIGEVSVAIAVASPHRAEAYEASRYVIEELKGRVPVWKREGYLDGDSAWLSGAVPPQPEAR